MSKITFKAKIVMLLIRRGLFLYVITQLIKATIADGIARIKPMPTLKKKYRQKAMTLKTNEAIDEPIQALL